MSNQWSPLVGVGVCVCVPAVASYLDRDIDSAAATKVFPSPAVVVL